MIHKNKSLDGIDITYEMEAELCEWNDSKVAFIKRDMYEGKKMWLIYAADGTKIAATDDRDFAFIMAKQNDFIPQSVH